MSRMRGIQGCLHSVTRDLLSGMSSVRHSLLHNSDQTSESDWRSPPETGRHKGRIKGGKNAWKDSDMGSGSICVSYGAFFVIRKMGGSEVAQELQRSHLAIRMIAILELVFPHRLCNTLASFHSFRF